MKKHISIILCLIYFSSPAICFTEKDFTNKKLLCSKLLWGFDFVSSNKVQVIITDLNSNTLVKEYKYDTDLNLSYINIFQNEDNVNNRVYSIELNSLRVDIWTMTGGGFTTREMFPSGFCKFINNKNLFSLIESLKLSMY